MKVDDKPASGGVSAEHADDDICPTCGPRPPRKANGYDGWSAEHAKAMQPVRRHIFTQMHV